MAHFPKPAEGSWTEHYPELGTAPVSYEDSISPEHYEREREAIFKRSWLNVGRVEQLPRTGSYLTKELDAARTSVVVVRTGDGELRAFHNMCRHRGNKLVWADVPTEETSGTCRQFTCKYHGWRYGLEGDLTFVQQEGEFFDLDKADYGLAPVQVDVWEGFIFVHLDPGNVTSVREYLGEFGAGIAGYPFDRMTQVYKYRADVGANWKLFIDAFAEFYHAPVLHAKQAVAEESRKLIGVGFEALAYRLDGPHGMVSSWGGMAPPKDLAMVKPIERVLRSGLFGPWDRPDIGIDELPPAINPARSSTWGVDAFVLFPNFMLLVWAPNWYLTYHYWPTAYNRHIFEGTLHFVPPTTARERLRQELAAVTFKEYSLQDGNTLEATQRSIESRAVQSFPLNDQEILLRHLHKTARDWVDEHGRRSASAPVRNLGGVVSTLPGEFADLEPFADWSLETEAQRYAMRLASNMDELQAFYDAAFPRLEDAITYVDQFRFDALPDDAKHLLWLCYSLVNASFPVEVWRQPKVPDSGAASFNMVVEPAI